MNRSTGLLLLALLASLGASASSCASTSESAESPEGAHVTRGDLERELVLSGELQAVREQAVLVPREAAWRHPIRWMVEHGARVEEGDVVLEFDNQQAVQRLEEAELRVVSAINALVSKDASGAGEISEKKLDVARKQAERDKAALDAAIPKELRSEREWQDQQLALKQAETALEKAKADLVAAEAGWEADVAVEELALAKAERDRDAAQAAIELLSLKAPGSGIALVGDHPWEGRQLQLGDTVFAGHRAVSIPDLTEMRVVAHLSDVDDGLVQPGMEVLCVLDAHPSRSFPGVVRNVAPVATTPASSRSLRRAFRVDVDLLESDPALMLPGMSVRLEVQVESLRDVDLAPREAIERSGESWRVRLEDGSWIEAEIGACDAKACVVLSGLEGTERWASRAEGSPS